MRQRGVTLVELMIAMSLAAVVSAFMLMLTRGQLTAYEMSDQLTRAQQNARAGIDFMETTLRRACGGTASGRMLVMNQLGSVSEGHILQCLTFTNNSTAADELEVYYGALPCDQNGLCATKLIQTTTPPAFGTSPLVVTVNDTTGFTAPGALPGDYVVLSAYNDALVYQIASMTPTTITFNLSGQPGSYAGLLASPQWVPTQTIYASSGDPSLLNQPFTVLKLYGYHFALDTTAGVVTQNMLVVDGGKLGASSQLRTTIPQPLVDGVQDFQISIGVDANSDGTITEQPASPGIDEVIGNFAGENIPAPTALLPWGQPLYSTAGLLKTIRISLLVMTTNQYPGAPNVPTKIEDRSSWPVTPTDKSGPRLRLIRTVVAPRAWNPKI